MQTMIIPMITLTVTLMGGGILLYFLRADKKRQPASGEQAAMQTAQEFINVKDIREKFLYSRDGYVFLYLRIHAISIDLYSTSEKNTLIRTLTAELSDIQRPFKFLAVSRPVDISPVIQEMTELLPEAGEKQKELLKQEIVQMSGYALSGDIVERQFYLMIWEKQAEGCETDLQKTAALFCEKFGAGGVPCDILQEKEIVRLLNLVHNPAYSHLEEPDYEATIPLLKEGIV